MDVLAALIVGVIVGAGTVAAVAAARGRSRGSVGGGGDVGNAMRRDDGRTAALSTGASPSSMSTSAVASAPESPPLAPVSAPGPGREAVSAPVPARETVSASAPATDPVPVAARGEDIFSLATGLENFARKIAHPRDLLENERFRRGVELLLESDRTAEALLDYMGSGKAAIACMALEALARRTEPGDVGPISERIPADYAQVDVRPGYFALRALATRAIEPVVGRVLLHVHKDWAAPMKLGILREFISQRLAQGESPRFGDQLATIQGSRIEALATVLDRLKDLLPESLHEEFRAWRDSDENPYFSPPWAGPTPETPAASRVDSSGLEAIGRVWRPESAERSAVFMSERLDRVVAQAWLSLRADPPRAVAVIGEGGVGKSALIRALAHDLQKDGWTIFEAGAVELVAGQMYIGQLEERLRALISTIAGQRIAWVVPSFHELLRAGAHKDNPSGVLDRILPHLEAGEIRVIAEMTPEAYERLLQAKPQLRSALVALALPPADEAETLELSQLWAARNGSNTEPLLGEQALREARQLATQYLTNRALPGSVLDLLQLTHRRLTGAGSSAPKRITQEDLLLTLSQLTGLPLTMLDERSTLDLEGLRALFARRVIGQPEAVDCLVERVAMMKAGVTDPTRPAGVFLFVGPTGTGKTEIAKTLAQHLFGSAERMIRIDMSELQTAESLDRILGSTDGAESTALVNAIRRQPFSVVLLDEFEKAHPSVWDLFLQVFDDGRLTDRRGNVADFRHAVIILTSNLGATLPYGAVIGFIPGDAGFAVNSVERAVGETFRREFVNRIDRVVVFRPLGRVEMREILHKELDDVFRRRGLRNRTWAVEWEASAIDFLLDRGFTHDLGARPLKRAVERYLLAPLATTIVNHRVPAGDQFLFVRSDGDRLDVVFIDPDEIEGGAPEQRAGDGAGAADIDVRQLVLEAQGSREEVDFLDDHYADLDEEVQSAEWQQRKQDALAEMRSPGFWSSPRRFEVLGTAEYMDRIEAGLDTASSLLRRLTAGGPGSRSHYPRDLVQRLAQQLYLLEIACETLSSGGPRDAYLLVRASRDSGTDHARADEFAARVARAYREWAKKRRMRLDVIEEVAGNGAAPYSLLAAVSGFGAYTILEPEGGLHVLESPQDAKSFNRVKARVVLAPQEDAPVSNPRELRTRALAAIEAQGDERAQLVVRRYREEPSPLVRDAVRQWRTGRIDRVFGGDFDVMS